MGLIPNKSEGDIGFERHPLAYLVEAADDICYTIIDFEDGINLDSEDFALEYLIKLVKTVLIPQNIKRLPLRKIALVICELCNW
jgi:dGTPase